MTEDKDIDAAAEALLAAAGPDRLRRFREQFDDVPASIRAYNPTVVDVPLVTDDGILRSDEAPIRPDVQELVRDLTVKLRDKLDDADLANLSDQVKAFIDSTPFAEEVIRLMKSEPFSRLTKQILTVDACLRAMRLDFDLDISLDDLCKALTSDAITHHTIPIRGIPALKHTVHFGWTLPLTPLKRKMISALVGFLIDGSALAYRMRSDSLKLWREVYTLTLRNAGGPHATSADVSRPFPAKEAKRIVSLIADAYDVLFADGMAIQRNREIWGKK